MVPRFGGVPCAYVLPTQGLRGTDEPRSHRRLDWYEVGRSAQRFRQETLVSSRAELET
jgi:hypothetical protein